ncbi:MAG: peptide ABC transporter ATP-binding protein [Epulopiscium sp. Nele67-Bin004]|nr:MAG: peptide ABC transporter ATP-binding protein [Epulopiscium sp. Nele67-Bin004]
MEDRDIVLEVKNLTTHFKIGNKDVPIVKDVSFNLRRGKTMAIVGESGCGKSVTINSIMNLLPKNATTTATDIKYTKFDGGKKSEFHLNKMAPYGKEMRDLRGADIGMVFQDPMSSLNPLHRIGRQVMEGLLEHNPHMKKDEAKREVIKLLKKLEISDPENRFNCYPHQFSAGMKQRVVIAIAMICEPEIIIADEPTTALDVTIQAQIMSLMKKLQTQEGKSIILITHNMGLVADIADDVCIMYMGRVVEIGPVAEIFEKPTHPYTRALLKSIPVLGMDKNAELTTIPGIAPNPHGLLEGCDFANRCEFATKKCREGSIPLVELGNDHNIRCVRYPEFLDEVKYD